MRYAHSPYFDSPRDDFESKEEEEGGLTATSDTAYRDDHARSTIFSL
jgi:hypothetical protein